MSQKHFGELFRYCKLPRSRNLLENFEIAKFCGARLTAKKSERGLGPGPGLGSRGPRPGFDRSHEA